MHPVCRRVQVVLFFLMCSFVVFPSPQEKNNLEIDLNYKLKTLQQRLEQEQTEHRVTRAQLTDKYESIEEAKSAAMSGMSVLRAIMPCFTSSVFFSPLIKIIKILFLL